MSVFYSLLTYESFAEESDGDDVEEEEVEHVLSVLRHVGKDSKPS